MTVRIAAWYVNSMLNNWNLINDPYSFKMFNFLLNLSFHRKPFWYKVFILNASNLYLVILKHYNFKLSIKCTHHFISKNSVDAVLIKIDHPVEAPDLIISHLTVLDVYNIQGEIQP